MSDTLEGDIEIEILPGSPYGTAIEQFRQGVAGTYTVVGSRDLPLSVKLPPRPNPENPSTPLTQKAC